MITTLRSRPSYSVWAHSVFPSKPSADFVLGAPAARHFSRRRQPTQTGIEAYELSDCRLVIEEIKEAKAITSYTRWVDAVQARGVENPEMSRG
jgi:hypothetical protein